jgi:hypothetical protein
MFRLFASFLWAVLDMLYAGRIFAPCGDGMESVRGTDCHEIRNRVAVRIFTIKINFRLGTKQGECFDVPAIDRHVRWAFKQMPRKVWFCWIGGVI